MVEIMVGGENDRYLNCLFPPPPPPPLPHDVFNFFFPTVVEIKGLFGTSLKLKLKEKKIKLLFS